MSKRYTEGIAYDGTAILDNGKPITITEVLHRLNKLDELESDTEPKYTEQQIKEAIESAKEMEHNSLGSVYGELNAIDEIIGELKDNYK